MVECPKFITVFRSLLIFFSSFLEFNGQHLLIMIDVIKAEKKCLTIVTFGVLSDGLLDVLLDHQSRIHLLECFLLPSRTGCVFSIYCKSKK